MKINRIKNSYNSFVFGVINKIVALLFPFVIRTIIIRTLSTDYIGLNSLFSSILNILSLSELGFGTALVFSMYKPISEDDTDTINALLNLYKKIYRVIGIIVLVVGLAIMPFLPYLIDGSYPADINLYTLYLVYLANNVIGYFFFAYKQSLFSAHQRNDITSIISMICSTVMYVCQIVVLILFKNYYVYIIFLPLSSLANNLIVAYVTKKLYPQYFCKGKISSSSKKAISKQVYSLFLHKIGYVIQSSIDSICLSAFMGLTLLGKYNSYYYVLTAVEAFLTIFNQSVVAGIGNSLIVESKDYNKSFFYKILFLRGWIVTWCTVCMACLYQPFMNFWGVLAGEDIMLGISVVACLVLLFYINQMRAVVGIYKDALGMWYEDRFKPILISVFNLIFTLISAYFGFFEGVILSTAMAYLLVGFPWETQIFFKKYMGEKPKKYLLKQIYYVFVTVIAIFATYEICALIQADGIFKIILNFIVCLIVPNVIMLIFYFKTNEFKQIMRGETVKKILLSVYYKIPRFIKNREIAKINKRDKIFAKIKKKYAKIIDKNIVQDDSVSDYVFVCWLQGEENAPDLVKTCIKSIKKHFSDKKVVVISNENMFDYVEFPDFILKKWKKGIISNTHLSDILRVMLIEKYGGLWLDSTVLCTGNLSNYVDEKTNLFVFRNEHKNENAICLSSWLIYAKPNNPIISNTKRLLFEYWKNNNKLINYFLFHIIFTVVAGEFADEWNKVPAFNNLNPHMLWFYDFYSPFTEKRFEQLKQMSNFHKLSYKFDSSLVKKDSFCDKILRGNYEKN